MKPWWRNIILSVPLCLLACTTARALDPQALGSLPTVVAYSLAPGAAPKGGVSAISDVGSILFSPMVQESLNESINAYTGGLNKSFPRWVRVTWRTGDDISFDRVNGGWKGGKIVGDYTVNVLDRIPNEVFAYARAKSGRSIVLRFRLKDNGVMFAWDVQESSKLGQAWVYTMHAGDF